MSSTLLWFRQDLRLQDNPALMAALARREPVIPVYVLDDAGDGGWPAGGASRWWLHHALAALDADLRARGSRLILAHGESGAELDRLRRATGAGAIFWNRRYEPAVIARDAALKTRWTAEGVEAKSFNAALLHEPHTIANKQGKPFQVFTPFWKAWADTPLDAWPEVCDYARWNTDAFLAGIGDKGFWLYDRTTAMAR